MSLAFAWVIVLLPLFGQLAASKGLCRVIRTKLAKSSPLSLLA
jgi:hypothetical protein